VDQLNARQMLGLDGRLAQAIQEARVRKSAEHSGRSTADESLLMLGGSTGVFITYASEIASALSDKSLKGLSLESEPTEDLLRDCWKAFDRLPEIVKSAIFGLQSYCYSDGSSVPLNQLKKAFALLSERKVWSGDWQRFVALILVVNTVPRHQVVDLLEVEDFEYDEVEVDDG